MLLNRRTSIKIKHSQGNEEGQDFELIVSKCVGKDWKGAIQHYTASTQTGQSVSARTDSQSAGLKH